MSEGGKVVSTLAADVFDFHCTYREIVTKQVNGGVPTFTRRARNALAVISGTTC